MCKMIELVVLQQLPLELEGHEKQPSPHGMIYDMNSHSWNDVTASSLQPCCAAAGQPRTG